MQHLEPRKDNLTNTITSVQKDNYVAEPQVIKLGNLNRPGWHKENGTVLSPGGLATTIMAQSNNAIKKVAIKTANKKGYDMATDGDGIDLGYPNSTTRRGRVGHGVSKTIPTGGGR